MKKRLIIFVQLTPVVLSLLLIGAHFFRAGYGWLVFLSLILAGSLIVREPFIARIVQIGLLLSSFEWVRLAYVFSTARMEIGQPWMRLAIIIGAVAFVAFISIFLFSTRSLKDLYHLDGQQRVFPTDTQAIKASAQPSNIAGGQEPERPASPEFLKIHNAKITLNILSPLVFLLMDSFMGIGVLALVGVGLGNNLLRRKGIAAGGRLSPEQKKASFFWQTIAMLAVSAGVMVYFYVSLEFIRVKVIILFFVAVYTLLVCAAAYLEYISVAFRHSSPPDRQYPNC